MEEMLPNLRWKLITKGADRNTGVLYVSTGLRSSHKLNMFSRVTIGNLKIKQIIIGTYSPTTITKIRYYEE